MYGWLYLCLPVFDLPADALALLVLELSVDLDFDLICCVREKAVFQYIWEKKRKRVGSGQTKQKHQQSDRRRKAIVKEKIKGIRPIYHYYSHE